MSKLAIEITTPERTLWKDSVDSATIPTSEGEITVLPGHIPLVTILAPGELTLRKDGQETNFAVSTGFIRVVNGDSILILADTAEYATELELERVEKAIEEARERAARSREEHAEAEDRSFAEAAAAL